MLINFRIKMHSVLKRKTKEKKRKEGTKRRPILKLIYYKLFEGPKKAK